MNRKNALLTLLLITMGAFSGYAQLSILNYRVNGLSFTAEDLITLEVMNAGLAQVQVSVVAELKAEDGQILCRVSGSSIAIPPGNHRLDGLASAQTVEYGDTPEARFFMTHQKLLEGNYESCVRIKSDGNEVPTDLCIPLVSVHTNFLQLVYPAEAEVITTLNPVLTWTSSQVLLGSDPLDCFQMVLTEKRSDQTAGQALAENDWQLYIPQLNARSVVYPINVKALEVGKAYAWHVIHTYDGKLIESSDAWWFEVKEWEDPRDTKYVDLTASPSSRPVKVYDSFYFRFDEAYNSSDLTLALLDEQLKSVDLNVANDLGVGAIKKNGFNGYRVVLSGCGLKQGLYTMVIKDGKNKEYKILIEYIL